MLQERNLKQSNFELLRIISMLFIIIYHCIYHGHVIENCTNDGIKLIFTIIELVTIVHVNSFVLITGYFQSKSKFKQAKIWSLINSSLFYRILIIIILTCLGCISLSKVDILRETFILNINQYWFVRIYIFLYCLSPFLNKLISNLDKRYYQKLLLVLFVLFSILPYITGNKAFDNSGYTLYNFIYLYLIGAYLRRYPISKSYIFNNCSKNLYRVVLASVFCFCVVVNYLIFNTSTSLLNTNSIINEIANNFISMTIMYSNPIVIIQAIAFFLLFETFDFKSKIINNISKLTLGIYMIHDNSYLRTIIYGVTDISNNVISSYRFIFYVIIVAFLLFIICGFIEFIRQKVFKFIYDRKISLKIRDRYYNWIHSLKFE